MLDLDQLIRRKVVRGAFNNSLVLTKAQLTTLHHVQKHQRMLAHSLALLTGISVPNASGKLVRLYNAGYLTRTPQEAPTGGYEYLYKAVKL